MVKTGLKIYRNNIWHFFTILGFVALGLIIAFSIMIPAMMSTVNKTTNDIAEAGKFLAPSLFNVDKFFSSLGDQFKALDWANPLNTLKSLFTEAKLVQILSTAVTYAGIDLKSLPDFEKLIISSARTIVDTSVTQLFVLVFSVAICSIVGYVLIRTVVHFKTTKNYNIVRYIINVIANILLIGLIAFLFVIVVQKLDGAVMWICLIAITLFQIVGELTISFLSFAKKGIKFKDIVNLRTVISSLVTSFVIVAISFAIVAIIYPFNSLAAIMVAIPLLLITTIIMDSVTNAFVNNFNEKSIKYFIGGKNMNFGKVILARIYQKVLYLGVTAMHFKEPKVIKGENSSKEIYKLLNEKNVKDVLVVVDDGLFKVPFTSEIIKSLTDHNIKVSVFHEFTVNPTIKNVEDGLKVYEENHHTAIIGLGGGSSLDTAKMIGARANNPTKTVADMKGLLKVRHKLPLLIAIPTTAGTGSETTVAAVIIDGETRHKYPIEDPKLTPLYAILDPTLLVKLPPQVTSTTGMDALTHAVEAYTNRARTPRIRRNALEAIKLIYENLEKSYSNPNNLIYRNNMQVASYKAGVAFTNGYVGYVHALAHALGGLYNVPHGLANSLILPIVLKEYGNKIYGRVAKIYDYVGMGETNISKKEKTERFIKWVYDMNRVMNIHSDFNSLIKDEDIDTLSNNAYKEGYPLYPCPKMFSREELKNLYLNIKKENKE